MQDKKRKERIPVKYTSQIMILISMQRKGAKPNPTVRQCSAGRLARKHLVCMRTHSGSQNFVKLAPDSVQWRKEAEALYNACTFLRVL